MHVLTILNILTILAMLATLVTLGYGIIEMMNPQTNSPQKRNKIMRWRIFFQALALFFLAMLLLYSRH